MVMNLNAFDLFGSPLNLNVGSKKYIKTKEGALFTILVVIISLVATWLLGNDLFYKMSPISFQEDVIMNKYAEIRWNQSSLPISFAIQDWDGVNLDVENFFDLKFLTYHYKTDKAGVMRLIETKIFNYSKCNYMNFPVISKDEFDSIGLNYTYCAENFDVNLKGYWSESEFIYYEFMISICQNKTECKSFQEIEYFIKSNRANLQIYYVDSVVKLNNFSNPIIKKINAPFIFIDSRSYKLTNFYLQLDKIITDDAIFSESYNYKEFFSVHNTFLDTTYYDAQSGILLQVDFYSSNVSRNYYRKYIKLTEIAASVGGVINFLCLFSIIFREYYSDFEKKIIIINELFKQCDIGEENLSNVNDKNKIITTISKLAINRESKIRIFPTEIQKEEIINKVIKIKNENELIDTQSKIEIYNFSFYERLNLIIFYFIFGKPIRNKRKPHYEDFIHNDKILKNYFNFIHMIKKINYIQDINNKLSNHLITK
jgi:hypothetical protein